MKQFFEISFQRSIVINALKICLIVGTILNLINQGSIILSMNWGQLSVFKLLLTFSVAYCVSTYSATIAHLNYQKLNE